MTKIKSFKELKRKKFNVCLDCGRINCQNADHCSQPAIWVSDVNSFEAGLEKRIEDLKYGVTFVSGSRNAAALYELRRLLEGEGGEKGKG